MTPAAYRIWRLGHELSHAQMGHLTGEDASTSSRRELGRSAIPGPVARLLALCSAHPELIPEVEAMGG